MKAEKDISEINIGINNEIPGFDSEQLLKYTKGAITHLYHALKNNQKVNLNCKKELLDKLIENKHIYKISPTMDNVTVTYVKLFDYYKENNILYIKIYASIQFYDNALNNNDNSINDKFWNDIWIVTYKQSIAPDGKNISNCSNCGATMNYDEIKNIFTCKYCGNIVYNSSNVNWEIFDINLGN